MNISQLLVKLRLDNSQFNAGMAQSQQSLRGLDTSAKGMMDSMKFAGLMGMAFMGRQALAAVVDLGKLGAQGDRVRTSFEELARQAGGSANELLAAVRRASSGTVSEMDAILAINKGILLGLGAQAEQWEQLTEVARFRARAMGITMTQALSDISMGIGRESRLILDNLGIILDMDRITADWADTLGKTADQLTVMERKQAILNAVIAEGQVQIRAAGGITDDTGDKIERSSAAWSNLKETVGRLLDEPIADLLTELSTLASRLQLQADALDLAASGAITYEEALKRIAEVEAMPSADVSAAVAAMEELKSGDLELQAASLRLQKAQEDLAQAQALYNAVAEEGAPIQQFAAATQLQQAQAALRAAEAAELAASSQVNLATASAEAAARGRGWAAEMYGQTAAEQTLEKATERLERAQADYAASLASGSSAQAFYARATLEAAGAAYEEARAAAEAEAATRELGDAASGSGYAIGSMTVQIGDAAAAAAYATGIFTNMSLALDAVKTDIEGISVQEIGTGFGSAADQLATHLGRLSTLIDLDKAEEIYGRYLAQLEDLYREAAKVTAMGGRMTELELSFRREQILASFDEELKIIEDAAKDQKDALGTIADQYNDLRGIVSTALRPTDVTGLDMEMAALGQYVDKWDESARRLDAIAARGFAELEAHPDWAAALKIPEGVLSGSETALKDWARRTSDAVRNLFRPDLIDIEDAADAVEAYMRDMAAREVTIDLIVKELQTRGVSEEQARKQVLEMYGLEEELPVRLTLAPEAVTGLITAVGTPDIPVTLSAPTEGLPGLETPEIPTALALETGTVDALLEEIGTLALLVSLGLAPEAVENFLAEIGTLTIPTATPAAAGAELAASIPDFGGQVESEAGGLIAAGDQAAVYLGQGLQEGIAALAVGTGFTSRLSEEMKSQQKALYQIGVKVWGYVEEGLEETMTSSTLIEQFVAEIMPFIIRKLETGKVFAGGQGNP